MTAAGSTSRTSATTSAASIWALGEILSTAWAPALVEPTQRLLDSLVGGLNGPTSLETDAYVVLGLARLDPDRLDDPARRLLECGVDRLSAAFDATASDRTGSGSSTRSRTTTPACLRR